MPRVLIALGVSVLWFYAVAGSSKFSGPVLFDLGPTHGVHRDDLLVTAIWLGTLWAVLTRPSSR